MTSFILRNDDVAFSTDYHNLVEFCEICDKYKVKIIQAITPLGKIIGIESHMTDAELVAYGGKHTILDNYEVINYLRTRDDAIGVHGLWHTHSPSANDISLAKDMLIAVNLTPSYFCSPFNEGDYPPEVHGLKVSGKTQRLEDYLPGMPKQNEVPTDPIVYLHEWRFNKDTGWYKMEDLDKCLSRITNIPA